VLWVWVIVLVAIIGGIAVVAAGRGDAMAEVYDDRPDALLPADRPLCADDLRTLRLNTGVRGYRMDEVDALLARLEAEMIEREEPVENDERRQEEPMGEAAEPDESWQEEPSGQVEPSVTKDEDKVTEDEVEGEQADEDDIRADRNDTRPDGDEPEPDQCGARHTEGHEGG
jgi:DivIVA domain-containing protein